MTNSVFRKACIPQYVFPFIGGLLYAAGFPMTFAPSFFIFPILGMALLLHSFGIIHESEEKSLTVQMLSLLSFSVSYCLLGYYWIPHTLKEFGEIPFPFNYTLGVLFSLIIVPQFWFFLLSHKLIKKLNFKTSFFVSSNSRRYCLFAFFLTIAEYFTPQQFPAHLGHPWLQLSPYLGLAPYFGAPLFSFFSYWMALGLIGFFKTRKFDKWLAGLTFVFLLLNAVFHLKPAENTINKDNIRLVQGNIGNYLKVSSENGRGFAINKVLQTFYKLSSRPSDFPLDLVVWPETAYPRLMNSELLKLNTGLVPDLFKDTINDTGAELFVGGYDKNKYDKHFFESEYNTAFHFSEDFLLKDRYHKIKLIPFGESLPFGPFNRFFSSIISNISFFAQGKDYTLFKTRNGTPFTSAICYEILFSSFIRTYLNSVKEQPDFLINITNDSWYGDTAEPYQHLYLAHWRSLEFDLPIIRMTNTGITSLLFPDGSESRRLGIGEAGILDYQLKTKKRSPTFFQRFGVWGTLMVCMFIYLIMFLVEKIIPSRKSLL